MKRVTCALCALVILVVSLACASSAWSHLPQSEKDVFNRCSESMVDARAGHDHDELYRNNWRTSLMNDYAREADDRARRLFLLHNGCPPGMVGLDDERTAGGEAPRCIAGASVACVCADGRSGAQVCQSNGAFAPCSCASRAP